MGGSFQGIEKFEAISMAIRVPKLVYFMEFKYAV